MKEQFIKNVRLIVKNEMTEIFVLHFYLNNVVIRAYGNSLPEMRKGTYQ